MKKVLIALDYGPTAQTVAEAGYAMAMSMGAEIVLLHVMASPVYYASDAYSPVMGFGGFVNMDLLQPDVADYLKMTSMEFLENTKRHLGDTEMTTLVKEGDTADVILESAAEVHADIIVMGTHSRRWLEELMVGSVAKHVLSHSKVPLFIIPVKK